MAKDVVDQAAMVAGLVERPCPTESLLVHGWLKNVAAADPLYVYGTEAPAVRALAEERGSLGQPLHERLPVTAAQVVWAVRREMARTVEDVLARRTRALLLDARASIDAVPAVARIMDRELGRGRAWQKAQVAAYTTIAQGYVLAAPA